MCTYMSKAQGYASNFCNLLTDFTPNHFPQESHFFTSTSYPDFMPFTINFTFPSLQLSHLRTVTTLFDIFSFNLPALRLTNGFMQAADGGF